MNHRFVALTLSCVTLLAACAGETPPAETPAEPAAKAWAADILAGPFNSVGAFCVTQNVAACEERDDVILAIGDAKKPLFSKENASIQVVGVASNDGATQKAHLLLKRDAEYFALSPAQQYQPKDGNRHLVTIRSFSVEASGLFIVTWGTETTTGTGDTQRQQMTARQAYCRVIKELPVACALFDTERSVATGADLATVKEQTAEVLVLPGTEGRVTVSAHAQSGAEALKGLAEPGEYRLVFP